MRASILTLTLLTLAPVGWAEQVCVGTNPVLCKGWMSQAQIDKAEGKALPTVESRLVIDGITMQQCVDILAVVPTKYLNSATCTTGGLRVIPAKKENRP